MVSKKKVKFELQEVASVVIDAIATACLTASGVSVAQASFNKIGGVQICLSRLRCAAHGYTT